MSLTARVIAYTIIALALIAAPHALVPTASPREASRPLPKADWSSADLVCEIEGDVWAVDIDSKEPQKVLLIENATNPSVRPGTRDIAFVRGDDIWLWSAADGSQKEIASDVLSSGAWADYGTPPQLLGRLAWHPGGRWLAFSAWRSVTCTALSSSPTACKYYGGDLGGEWWFAFIFLLDTQGGACYELVGPATDTGPVEALLEAQNPAWSRTGDMLAFTRMGDVWALEDFHLPEDGKRNASWDTERLEGIAWLEDGQRCSNASRGAVEVSYTPDGKGIIARIDRLGGSGFGSATVVPLWGPSGKKYKNPGGPWLNRVLADLPAAVAGLAVPADGKRVVYTTWEGLWLCESPSTKSRSALKGWVHCPSWIEVAHE